jgi:hydrogenase maturation factor HypF (carbamoyltransferase family)
MNFTLHQLQIYLKVVEKQSITKASNDLFLTQPAISIQLKNFQDQFEFPLIDVVGKKVCITDFGKDIALAAQRILQEIETIKYSGLIHQGKLFGRLKISVVSTAKYVMPYFLSDFLNENDGVELSIDVTNKHNCLAFGADMKSAFAWLYTGNTYVSQYLGDLDHFDTQRNFRHTLDHFFQLLGARPEHLLTDLHPGYFSHQLAREYASSLEVPVWTVPHHEAHVGAVLAEHDLFGADEPVLAVVFDGTGLGTDGQIWGGEFFVYRSRTIRRAGHLAYFPHLAGDKMAREPRLCALALASGIPDAVPLVRPWFTDQEWAIYAKWQKRPGVLQTSSMGRVFDGVAALCGFPVRCTYEGEAAMLLETAALAFFEKHGWETETPYACRLDEGQIGVGHLIEQVVRDRRAGADGERIAARFHGWVCEAVRRVAVQENIRSLAFSGGVFQNAVLTELLALRLGKDFRLYFHREMPSNDENIGLGQIALFQEGLIPGKNVPFDASPKLPVA